jgi:hypothetical protein
MEEKMRNKVSIGILSALLILAGLGYELGCGGDTRTRGTGSDGEGNAMVAGNGSSEEAVSPCAPLVSSSSLTAYAGKVTALNFSGGSVDGTAVSGNDVTGVQLVNPTTLEAVDVPIVGETGDGAKVVVKIPTSGLTSDHDYEVKVLTGVSACSTINLSDRLSMIDRPSLGTTVVQDSNGTQTVDFAGTSLELFDFREGISVFAGTLGVKKIDSAGNVLSFVKYIDGTGVGDAGKIFNQFCGISMSQMDIVAHFCPKGETGADTRSITVMDTVTGARRVTFDTDLASLQAIAISPNGDSVIAGLLTTVKRYDVTSGEVLQNYTVPAGCGALKKIRWFSNSADVMLFHANCALKRNNNSIGDIDLTTPSDLVNGVLFRDESKFSTINSEGVVRTYTLSSNSGFTQSGSDIGCALSGVADAEMSLDDATLHLVSDDGATHCAVDFSSGAATKATLEAAVDRLAICSESGDCIRGIKRNTDSIIRKFKKPD